jgi:hypothetical protein
MPPCYCVTSHISLAGGALTSSCPTRREFDAHKGECAATSAILTPQNFALIPCISIH